MKTHNYVLSLLLAVGKLSIVSTKHTDFVGTPIAVSFSRVTECAHIAARENVYTFRRSCPTIRPIKTT